MTEKSTRTLKAEKGFVKCLPDKSENVEKCRFCVHSVAFLHGEKYIKSPARAFCTLTRSTEEVSLKDVTEVVCDDLRGEGYRSMMNVIS
ncbi:MAG: hypothetical protein PHI15_04345 [Methanomicrobium sp.]|nr:hypothetical protein [Methanomicrobium sp.]